MRDGTGRRDEPQIERDAQHEGIDELLAVEESMILRCRRLWLFFAQAALLAGGGIGTAIAVLLGGNFRLVGPMSVRVAKHERRVGRWMQAANTSWLDLGHVGTVQHLADQVGPALAVRFRHRAKADGGAMVAVRGDVEEEALVVIHGLGGGACIHGGGRRLWDAVLDFVDVVGISRRNMCMRLSPLMGGCGRPGPLGYFLVEDVHCCRGRCLELCGTTTLAAWRDAEEAIMYAWGALHWK